MLGNPTTMGQSQRSKEDTWAESSYSVNSGKQPIQANVPGRELTVKEGGAEEGVSRLIAKTMGRR